MPLISRNHCRFNDILPLIKAVDQLSEVKALLPKSLHEDYDRCVQELQNNHTEFRMRAALRLTRLFSKKYLEFLLLLQKYHDNNVRRGNIQQSFDMAKYFENSPLMFLDTDQKVVVFPNITLSIKAKTDLNNMSSMIWANPSIISSFLNDSAVPSSLEPNKIWKKLRTAKSMSLSRVLARHSKLRTVLSEHYIRDLAEMVEEEAAPLKLLYANTPKDYIRMFSNGPGSGSCMTLGGAKTDMWEPILHKDHHPMSLFAYHDFIKGVYVKSKTGKIRARTLLYGFVSSEDPKIKYKYGRMFYESPAIKQKFEDTLRGEGYTRLPEVYTTHSKDIPEYKFTVSGIKYNDNYYMPLPYFDNLKNIQVQFNDKTNNFELRVGKGITPNVSTSSTGGFIIAKDLQKVACRSCGNPAGTDSIIHHRNNEIHLYCGQICLRREGLTLARDKYNDIKVYSINRAYYDVLNTSNVYTCRNAMLSTTGAKNFLLYINTKILEPSKITENLIHNSFYFSDYYLTTRGIPILFRGQEYILPGIRLSDSKEYIWKELPFRVSDTSVDKSNKLIYNLFSYLSYSYSPNTQPIGLEEVLPKIRPDIFVPK